MSRASTSVATLYPQHEEPPREKPTLAGRTVVFWVWTWNIAGGALVLCCWRFHPELWQATKDILASCLYLVFLAG